MRKLMFVMMMVCCAMPVMAQPKYSIKSMTPEVQSALNSRRDRFDELRSLKSKGLIGETNRGYVKAFGAEAESIVGAENADRKVIYQTIAEQNGLDNAVSTIEKVFADVQRDKAEDGDKVQEDSGQWGKK